MNKEQNSNEVSDELYKQAEEFADKMERRGCGAWEGLRLGFIAGKQHQSNTITEPIKDEELLLKFKKAIFQPNLVTGGAQKCVEIAKQYASSIQQGLSDEEIEKLAEKEYPTIENKEFKSHASANVLTKLCRSSFIKGYKAIQMSSDNIRYFIKEGDKVTYCPSYGEKEHGMVKSLDFSRQVAFVVYECNNEWSMYREYTGYGTKFQDLKYGWV